MTQTTYYDAFPAMEPVRVSTVETLLTCYPRISKDEITDITSFLRTASIIDPSYWGQTVRCLLNWRDLNKTTEPSSVFREPPRGHGRGAVN